MITRRSFVKKSSGTALAFGMGVMATKSRGNLAEGHGGQCYFDCSTAYSGSSGWTETAFDFYFSGQNMCQWTCKTDDGSQTMCLSPCDPGHGNA
jgi:hypothetical protein